MKIYVEGGGDTNSLKTMCRQGFSEFLKKAGLMDKMPRIVACGGRRNAYDLFAAAISHGEPAMLLVDSETPVAMVCQPEDKPDEWKPWKHLKERKGDEWDTPDGATDQQCHLMTQCMESWFLADRTALAAFYGQDFHKNALPSEKNPIEKIEKLQVYYYLSHATRDCETKGKYNKADHSFELLAAIDPNKVISASSWAKHFVEEIKRFKGV